MYPFYRPAVRQVRPRGAHGASSMPRRSIPDLRGGRHGCDSDRLPRSLASAGAPREWRRQGVRPPRQHARRRRVRRRRSVPAQGRRDRHPEPSTRPGPGGDRHEELYVVVQGCGDVHRRRRRRSTPRRGRRSSSATRRRCGRPSRPRTTRSSSRSAAPAARRTGVTPAQSAGGLLRTRTSAKDYAAALAATKRGARARIPATRYLLYNVACMEALLGNGDAALTALAESVAQWEPYKELAQNGRRLRVAPRGSAFRRACRLTEALSGRSRSRSRLRPRAPRRRPPGTSGRSRTRRRRSGSRS